MAEPKLTTWERAKVAALIAKGTKRAVAGISEMPDIERDIARVYETARKRTDNSK